MRHRELEGHRVARQVVVGKHDVCCEMAPRLNKSAIRPAASKCWSGRAEGGQLLTRRFADAGRLASMAGAQERIVV